MTQFESVKELEVIYQERLQNAYERYDRNNDNQDTLGMDFEEVHIGCYKKIIEELQTLKQLERK